MRFNKVKNNGTVYSIVHKQQCTLYCSAARCTAVPDHLDCPTGMLWRCERPTHERQCRCDSPEPDQTLAVSPMFDDSLIFIFLCTILYRVLRFFTVRRYGVLLYLLFCSVRNTNLDRPVTQVYNCTSSTVVHHYIVYGDILIVLAYRSVRVLYSVRTLCKLSVRASSMHVFFPRKCDVFRSCLRDIVMHPRFCGGPSKNHRYLAYAEKFWATPILAYRYFLSFWATGVPMQFSTIFAPKPRFPRFHTWNIT